MSVGNVKPKLGNAEGLFKSKEPHAFRQLAPQNPDTRKRLGWLAGFVSLLCLLASVVLFQQLPQPNTQDASVTPETPDGVADGSVVGVRVKDQSGALVGTLVSLENTENPAVVTSDFAVTLTEQERKKLLEIINAK